jgi:hypothetical protein
VLFGRTEAVAGWPLNYRLDAEKAQEVV